MGILWPRSRALPTDWGQVRGNPGTRAPRSCHLQAGPASSSRGLLQLSSEAWEHRCLCPLSVTPEPWPTRECHSSPWGEEEGAWDHWDCRTRCYALAPRPCWGWELWEGFDTWAGGREGRKRRWRRRGKSWICLQENGPDRTTSCPGW